MKKIFTIAIREYRAMVGTKAFMISMIMMPILMLGGLFAMEILKDAGTVAERKIAIIDPSNAFFDTLQASIKTRNMFMFPEHPIETEDQSDDGFPGFAKEKYILEKVEGEPTDALKLELSDRIRNQDLYAFVEIPTGAGELGAGPESRIRFYAQDSSLSEARNFVSASINEAVKAARLTNSGMDPEVVQKLVAQLKVPVLVSAMGLVVEAEDGSLKAKEENDPMKAIFLPMGVMMLMFMVIFMASQPMLEGVLEEKSQRIAEVLLGSANSFQLMSGKLIGTVGGSLTIFAIYVIGAYFLAVYRDWTDMIPFHLVPWFMVFQILGVLFYAAIFLAVGASVSQLKEAQSLLLPVWMMMMSPMMVWIFIVRDPLGPMATYFSLFPPATPTAMMLRMATGQTIPLWQPILGAVLTLVATFFIVTLAARIFRVGILWQGKTPKLGEILKWAVTG